MHPRKHIISYLLTCAGIVFFGHAILAKSMGHVMWIVFVALTAGVIWALHQLHFKCDLVEKRKDDDQG